MASVTWLSDMSLGSAGTKVPWPASLGGIYLSPRKPAPHGAGVFRLQIVDSLARLQLGHAFGPLVPYHFAHGALGKLNRVGGYGTLLDLSQEAAQCQDQQLPVGQSHHIHCRSLALMLALAIMIRSSTFRAPTAQNIR